MSAAEMPDLNDLRLLQEPVVVDGDVSPDDFFSPPLPDDGDHLAVLHMGDRGLRVSRQKDDQGNRTGTPFLNVHIQAKIIDDKTGEEGISVFDNPTSIVMPSSGTSRLHMILAACGNPAPPRTTLGDLKQHVEVALAQSPKCLITTQWQAQVNRGTQEKPDYQTVCSGQRKFQPERDGAGEVVPNKFDPEVTDVKSGTKVRAQARITRFGLPTGM